MMERRYTRYLLVMILPLVVLLARPLIPAVTLMFGSEIKLETLPLDPREIFRGDYVELRFAITNIPIKLASPEFIKALKENGPI